VVAVDIDAAGLAGPSVHAGVVPLAGDVATEDANVAAVELALDRIIAVNRRGVMLWIRAAVPALRAGGGGAINDLARRLFAEVISQHGPTAGRPRPYRGRSDRGANRRRTRRSRRGDSRATPRARIRGIGPGC
jgi:hypothetical protein